MLNDAQEHNWTEKYRPKRLEDVILSPSIKRKLIKIRDVSQGVNLLFHGGYGMGKTTTAHLINPHGTILIDCAHEPERQIKWLHDQLNRGVFGDLTVILLDEAHNLKPSAQQSVKTLIEKHSTGCIYVITTNFPSKIDPAIHSRFMSISFDVDRGDAGIFNAMLQRAKDILAHEKIEADETAIAEIVHQHFPDMRKVVQALQFEFAL